MKRIILALLAVLAAAGCGSRQSKVIDRPYAQLADSDLVARFGQVAYTKGELEHDVAITEKLSALAGFAPHEMASRRDPTEFRRQIAVGFVARELLLQEAARRKLGLLPADMLAFQNQFAASVSSRMPMSFKGLVEALGPEATQFRNNLKKDALSTRMEQTLRQEFAAAHPAPSAADAAKLRQEALDFNRSLESANRSLARLATNSWKSIRAGNDFATVGRRLADMRREITFDPAYADPSGRLARVPSNLTLPPAPAEDGYEVVKATRSPDGARTVMRIFFRPQAPRAVPSAQEAAETLMQKAVDSAYLSWFDARYKASDIEIISFRN